MDNNILTDSDFTNGLEHSLQDILIVHSNQGHEHDFSQTKTAMLQKHLNLVDIKPAFQLQALISKITIFSKKYMKHRKQKNSRV